MGSWVAHRGIHSGQYANGPKNNEISLSNPPFLPCLIPVTSLTALVHWLSLHVCYLLIHIWVFATPSTEAHQAPLSMGFSRQEYWSGLPFPSPGDFPNPGSNPGLPYCRQIPYYLSHPGKPLHEVTIFRKEIDGLQDLSFSQRFSSSCCCSVTRSCLTLCNPAACQTSLFTASSNFKM